MWSWELTIWMLTKSRSDNKRLTSEPSAHGPRLSEDASLVGMNKALNLNHKSSHLRDGFAIPSRSHLWASSFSTFIAKELRLHLLRHMKRYPTSLIIRKVQNKTTMKYHLTAKSLQATNAGEDVEKREPSHYTVVGTYIGVATMGNSMECPQNTENRVTIWPSIPLLAIYQEKTKTLIPKDTYSTIYNSQDMEAI